MHNFLESIFINEDISDKKTVIKEINGMKNSQPPAKPTFIVNQKEIKQRITQKLLDCMNGYGFQQIVLSAKFGGGKTHFLNWLESRIGENESFYMVSFQVQESSIVKYSFIKMIVSKLFQQYYVDFNSALSDLVKDFSGDISGDSDRDLGTLSTKYGISNELSKLLYEIQQETKKKNAAIRIVGASHGRTEISKLGIKNLTDKDYIDIIQFFLKYREKAGFLLILLDEFEHAYLSLTPAARRNFFTSYKAFIDKAVVFEPGDLVLLTAVTEQSEGLLKTKMEGEEFALWTRIKHHVNTLSEFNPAKKEEFSELFKELAKRYNFAYNYTINLDNESEMRKRFFERLGGETTQAMSYREAIQNMLLIMDDLRMNKQSLEFTLDNITEFDEVINNAKKQWEIAHHNAKPALLKSAFERLLIDFNFEKGSSKDEVGATLYVTKGNSKKLLYISVASSTKSLTNNFNKCIKYKDALSESEENLETIFIYEKIWETDTTIQMMNLNPDIHMLSINELELYILLSYKNTKEENLKNKFVLELERLIKEIGD
ncbi:MULTISPECIES: BREX system ATP-binding domain-containing protein [Lysinibacillus]|uniref:BREX system ATP-binding domain-containing protein n=1 Tax=Lysinibacillus xylanilyticus TaxID=582475 RepID=A0ABV3W513_9BACI